ncbi:hypothetical protein V497_00112 [Pseudogymnoascus sp. VKM F-4516 (FW-969)]|nr:hypothetical protein V497_00112 [Pseudogymnoascus sp. VKM F-4516 (FW-969)]
MAHRWWVTENKSNAHETRTSRRLTPLTLLTPRLTLLTLLTLASPLKAARGSDSTLCLLARLRASIH